MGFDTHILHVKVRFVFSKCDCGHVTPMPWKNPFAAVCAFRTKQLMARQPCCHLAPALLYTFVSRGSCLALCPAAYLSSVQSSGLLSTLWPSCSFAGRPSLYPLAHSHQSFSARFRHCFFQKVVPDPPVSKLSIQTFVTPSLASEILSVCRGADCITVLFKSKSLGFNCAFAVY